MKKQILISTVIFSALLTHAAKKMPLVLDTNAIKRVAAMLPANPGSVGDPITKRDRWDQLRDHKAFAEVIPKAEKMLNRSIPEKTKSLYLDFSRTGNRSRWQKVDNQWYRRMKTLFFAECLENKGRFIPALEEILNAYCNERTWVMPAHDRKLETWNGKRPYADLKACDIGMSLAAIRHIMGNRLTPELRRRIKDEVIRRNLAPYKAQITGDTPITWWWITCTNNWNPVCLAGITEAALALIDDPAERAFYVVAAAAYSGFFLKGFTPDGYCSEGIAYWSYGYGLYVLLTEIVYDATDGGVDLLKAEGAEAAARFAGVIEIQNHIYPAFADCSLKSRPLPCLLYYLNRRYGFGFSEWDNFDPTKSTGKLCIALLFSFTTSADKCTPAEPNGPRLGKRTWFPDAGVLICRPGNNTRTELAAAIKGGHNAEHHNHNDVGTYIVLNNREALLVDPGREKYTRRTFSSKRYDSKILNSFGHPVPVVAGKLQSNGRKSRGEVISKNFSDDEDRFTIEMKSAYKVPELKSLRRTFVYSRKNGGSFSVSDRVIFDSPQSFKTALITIVNWKQKDKNTFFFRDFDYGVCVTIDTEGKDFVTEPVEIDEDVPRKPTRLGIRLTEPVTEALVTVTITPDNFQKTEKGELLFNGDFELNDLGWSFKNNMGKIEELPSSAGGHSLRISDSSKTSGSNITSSRIDILPGSKLSVSGLHLPIKGAGIGLYVKYYDENRKILNKTNNRGHTSPLLVMDAAETDSWRSFTKDFTPPEGTNHIRLWIHSMNSSIVEGLIDELKVSVCGKARM
ncbi:MAG: heparinase II/III family protein [Kiritimatiellia bacterium]